MNSATRRVLLVSHDTIGQSMAGPGIRYAALAGTLTQHARVTLAAPDPIDVLPTGLGVEIVIHHYQWDHLAQHAHTSDVIILPSDVASVFPQLATCKACLVIDGYDPLLSEWLSMYDRQDDADHAWRTRMRQLQPQFALGDFFICASERQRDWWLGMLEAHGRINPATHRADPTLRGLIDVVPYGLRASPPQRTKAALKGVWPGIAVTDRVVLWGGGLWRWLDPLSAIHAMGIVKTHRSDVRLVFPGTRHPNPLLADLQTHAEAARALAAKLDLLDTHVFFGDWVPYDQWPDVLLDSDLALTLGGDSLESRLAFRTRVLDYVWAALPTIASRGDATAELIEQYGLGSVVPCGDVGAIAMAILRWLDASKSALQAQFAQVQAALNWERAARPLIAYVRNPYRAPDRPPGQAYAAGNPHVADLVAAQAAQRAIIEGYERGRFMRAMKWLKRG